MCWAWGAEVQQLQQPLGDLHMQQAGLCRVPWGGMTCGAAQEPGRLMTPVMQQSCTGVGSLGDRHAGAVVSLYALAQLWCEPRSYAGHQQQQQHQR